MTLNQIIEALGGEAEVAKALGCGLSAISNWKARGLPPGRQTQLLMLAKKRRVRLTLAQIVALPSSRATPCGCPEAA
jgi:transposase